MGKGIAPSTPPLAPTSASGGQSYNFASQVTPPPQVAVPQLAPMSQLQNGIPGASATTQSPVTPAVDPNDPSGGYQKYMNKFGDRNPAFMGY